MFPGMEYLSYNRTLIVVGNAHPTPAGAETSEVSKTSEVWFDGGKGEKIDRLTARG
jgi:hypothetical protein